MDLMITKRRSPFVSLALLLTIGCASPSRTSSGAIEVVNAHPGTRIVPNGPHAAQHIDSLIHVLHSTASGFGAPGRWIIRDDASWDAEESAADSEFPATNARCRCSRRASNDGQFHHDRGRKEQWANTYRRDADSDSSLTVCGRHRNHLTGRRGECAARVDAHRVRRAASTESLLNGSMPCRTSIEVGSRSLAIHNLSRDGACRGQRTRLATVRQRRERICRRGGLVGAASERRSRLPCSAPS